MKPAQYSFLECLKSSYCPECFGRKPCNVSGVMGLGLLLTNWSSPKKYNTDAGNFWVIWEGLWFFKLSRRVFKLWKRPHSSLLLWEILLVLFKNKLNKMEGIIKVRQTVYTINMKQLLVCALFSNFEGSPLVLKPEGWLDNLQLMLAISLCYKWGEGDPRWGGQPLRCFAGSVGQPSLPAQCLLSASGTFYRITRTLLELINAWLLEKIL